MACRKWITNGIYSDYFTTAVRTSGKPGDAAGVSLLLIKRTDGLSTRKMKMGGQWAAGTTYVDFEDVKVPVENLIGVEGEGFKCLMNNFNHVRGVCFRRNVADTSYRNDFTSASVRTRSPAAFSRTPWNTLTSAKCSRAS